MKIFRKIHLWLSVPFGIIITLICLSGAMLIFEPEITRSIESDVYYVNSSGKEPLPMEVLLESVNATLPDTVSITGVTVFSDKDRTYQVNLSKPRRASIFIDQYSGRITGRYERLGFFSTMIKLHRCLLDSSNPHGDGVKVGKLLVGISTLILVISLITGVIIWWPRARKNFLHSISITFKNGWRGFWRSLHVAGGMYALIFVLVMSLTGLTWSFKWYRTAFYAVCGVENASYKSGIPAKERSEENRRDDKTHGINMAGHNGGQSESVRYDSDFGRWRQVYDELKTQHPAASQIAIGSETASVTLGGTVGGQSTDRYKFNQLTGEITPAKNGSTSAGNLGSCIYSIHTGNWGGLVTRILWLIGALLGASLPLTGYYIWIKRLTQKTRHTVLF